MYIVNSSELKPVKYNICALIPSAVYCGQLRVFSGLALVCGVQCNRLVTNCDRRYVYCVTERNRKMYIHLDAIH
jgi:hypothetical protein